MPVEKLLTPHEKAQELNVSLETLRRWRLAGDGPEHVRYGAKVRYYPEKAVA